MLFVGIVCSCSVFSALANLYSLLLLKRATCLGWDQPPAVQQSAALTEQLDTEESMVVVLVLNKLKKSSVLLTSNRRS